MTQDELFRVMDALNPSLSQVKAYLDRMCGVTPMELVYLKDGKFGFSNSYEANSADDLFGFSIPNTKKIICRKTLNRDCIKKLDLENDATLSQNIQDWLAREFYPFKARTAQKNDIDVLYKHLGAFRATLETLQYKGVSLLPKLPYRGPAWIRAKSEYCYDHDGMSNLLHYLKCYGDILIFVDLP
ncbi:MAG: hypothetical protein J6C85_06700 [Alphaproteobacteria bacterium]|nr:hypothetical protein [Alphaproteobacteria bacterium]